MVPLLEAVFYSTHTSICTCLTHPSPTPGPRLPPRPHRHRQSSTWATPGAGSDKSNPSCPLLIFLQTCRPGPTTNHNRHNYILNLPFHVPQYLIVYGCHDHSLDAHLFSQDVFPVFESRCELAGMSISCPCDPSIVRLFKVLLPEWQGSRCPIRA